MFNLPKKAIFIGADGSLGLKNGEKYYIVLKKGSYKGKEHIWIRVIGLFGEFVYCPYTSKELLLKNWMIKGELNDELFNVS